MYGKALKHHKVLLNSVHICLKLKLKTLQRKDTSDSIVVLEKSKNFTCEGSLKQQAENYLDNSVEARNKLDEYKDSVINLILNVLEEV